MKAICVALSFFSLVFSSFSLAHVSLSSSTPARGEVLNEPPSSLSIAFSGEVRVVKVKLKTSTGDNVNFGFTPPKSWSKQFSWPISSLGSATYQVDWIVMGKDGHKMKGAFEFTVQ